MTTQTTTASRNGKGHDDAAREALAESTDFQLPEPDWTWIGAQQKVWNVLLDHYFRVEVRGWERLPEPPCLIVGIHAGGILPVDAYAFGFSWFREFGRDRLLRGTAHDFLFNVPVIGTNLRKIGAIPASHDGIAAAFDAGEDVALYPGGDLDAMRPWWKRDEVVFGGRKGFIKMALEAQVPIVPVANVGASDTLFVVTDGEKVAKTLRLDKLMRAKTFPLGIGFPFGLLPAGVPQIPLPAKLRTEILDPIELEGSDSARFDDEYVERAEREVVKQLQAGVDRLAKRRSLPIFG
jgi:1-acyl-sn-glycerol-3-phosphate acyltransferase